MNQSLATLIRLKLFHGGQQHNAEGANEEKGGKKAGKHKGKQGRRSASSPVTLGRISHDVHGLNAIGEEAREGLNAGSDGEEAPSTHERRQSKLRTLKNKMSLTDLSFKTSSSTPQKPARTVSGRGATAQNASSPLEFPSQSKTTSSVEGSSLEEVREPTRPSSNAESLGSVPSRLFSSPVKNGHHTSSSTSSSVRISRANNKSAVTFPEDQLRKSETTISFRHSRSGSAEIKGSKFRAAGIGRRRSRTVDASDYVQNAKQNHDPSLGSSDLLSSISTHLKRSRSNSLASRSPIMKSQNNSHIQFSSITAVQGTASPTPPRLSTGSISFPAPQSTGQPPTSRRSSSIANAFNSLVNLRSSSASSMKGTSIKTATPKYEITLKDLPSPPEPLPTESEKEFLARLAPYGKFVAVILCEKNDPFKLQCLKSFLTNYFDFDYDPLDISMRKLLMFLELPKESQQIDRLLTIFAKVYYESQQSVEDICPWTSENQVYFVAFSLLMLHTDYFNHNNRYKMTKTEFVDLVHDDVESDGFKIPRDVLSYFYNNTIAKEFPKFDFSSVHQSLSVSHLSLQDTAGETTTVVTYSPIDIIQTIGSTSYEDYIISSSSFHGRLSSNSYSSYFPHIPTSTSSSSASVIQDEFDVYSYMLEDTLSELDMVSEVEKYWSDSCLKRTLTHEENKYDKYFSILREVKGGYLKVHKDDLLKFVLTSFEVLNEIRDDYRYFKIVQMGEFNEFTINKKFSIVGAQNRVSWKKEFAILTTCGLFIFDNVDWINPKLEKDAQTHTSNYIIQNHSNASMISASPISCNGLLATRKEEGITKSEISSFQILEEDSNLNDNGGSLGNSTANILYLRNSQKIYAWKCASKYERDNWVDSINLMAAFDGCFYDPGCLANTVVSLRKFGFEERVTRLRNAMEEKSHKLHELRQLLPFYRQAMPLSYKGRNELAGHIKQLAVRMDWLVYEIKRNEVYLKIIQQVRHDFGKFLSQSTEEESLTTGSITSPINESFIFNEELYPAGPAEDSFASKESLLVDNGEFLLREYDTPSNQ